MVQRPPTPPPYRQLLDRDEDDPERLPWFWNFDGGGWVLNFGKHSGQHIHDTSLSYLLFVRRECPYKSQFCHAFDKYYQGLQEIVETNWEDFIVPFGRRHRGQTVRQCRDKSWLLWARTIQTLTNKHLLFFRAVDLWIAHPRHYEVQRDIGESTYDFLHESQYFGDLGDGTRPEVDDTLPDDPTTSDEEFIAPSGEPSEVEDDDLDRAERAIDEAEAKRKKDKMNSPSKTKSTRSQKQGALSKAKGLHQGRRGPSPKAKRRRQKCVRRIHLKGKRREVSSDDGDFIEKQSSDGEASYEESSEPTDGQDQSPARITRARAKILQQSRSKSGSGSATDSSIDFDPSQYSRKNPKRADFGLLLEGPSRTRGVSSDGNDSDSSDTPTPRPPTTPRKRRIIETTDSEASMSPAQIPPDSDPIRMGSPLTSRASLSRLPTWSEHDESDIETPQKRANWPRVIFSADPSSRGSVTSRRSEDSEAETPIRSPKKRAKRPRIDSEDISDREEVLGRRSEKTEREARGVASRMKPRAKGTGKQSLSVSGSNNGHGEGNIVSGDTSPQETSTSAPRRSLAERVNLSGRSSAHSRARGHGRAGRADN